LAEGPIAARSSEPENHHTARRLRYCSDVMSKPLSASAVALILALQLGSCARPMKAVDAQTMQGVLTVTQVDRAGETITVRGPTGDESRIFVTPRIANLEQLQPGARLKVSLSEELAVGISKAGEPAAAAGDAEAFVSKDGSAAKTATKTVSATGVLEAVDTRSRRITLRGPQGKRKRSTWPKQ
jgi:hypothetical protein